MKGIEMKHAIVLFAALLFVPVLAIGTGHALDTIVVNANVPFDFYAGTKQMPAGMYNIAIDPESKAIEIRSADNSNAAFVLGYFAKEGSEQTQLVFDHIGDRYFLKTVASYDEVLDFPVRQTEAKLASADTPKSDTVVAFNGR
jgi:hypothetical protein